MHAVGARSNLRQIGPDLFASESHNGCKQSDQRFTDAPDRGLRAAPSPRLWRGDVQPVLEHIEVKSAQVDDTEVVHAVVSLVESKLLVRSAHIRGERAGLAQHVLVER